MRGECRFGSNCKRPPASVAGKTTPATRMQGRGERQNNILKNHLIHCASSRLSSDPRLGRCIRLLPPRPILDADWLLAISPESLGVNSHLTHPMAGIMQLGPIIIDY